jgi:hypothetical protein
MGDDKNFRLLTEEEARAILIHSAPTAEGSDLRIRAHRVVAMAEYRRNEVARMFGGDGLEIIPARNPDAER